MMLKLKSSDQIFVEIKSDGYIKVRRYHEFGSDTYIEITLEQFREIAKWINKNESLVQAAWNYGVKDDIES